MSTQKRIQVPDGLRDVLLEFSIAYLLEQPGDVVDFAVEFFTKLQESRRAQFVPAKEPLSPDEESVISQDEGKSLMIELQRRLRRLAVIFSRVWRLHAPSLAPKFKVAQTRCLIITQLNFVSGWLLISLIIKHM